ncbi:MAG: FapA family protein [Epsilonproteobacteria bacterium]|nr:FapA family protein [Campylobacterota bacterium]
MGLLNILKNKNKQQAPDDAIAFEKRTIETSDVTKDLEELARAHNLQAKDLDFKILSYKTHYKKVSSPRYRELQEIEREKFFKEENILNPELEILQKLKIEVFQKQGARFPIKIALGANKQMTKVVGTIKAQESVQYFDGLEGEILAEFDRKKAKQKILLGCFDDTVRNEVRQLVSSIRVNKKIEENMVFTICQGYDLEEHSSGEIKYRFKEKIVEEGEKVDHSDKGFMHTIKEGDVLLEIFRSKEGRAGRNCRGESLALEQVELTDELPAIKISDDIECVEKEESIVYIAKRSGFIHQPSDFEFEIRDELVVNEVSFKTTGSIQAGDDKDIKINIEGGDSMSDAIGAGVHIDTTEVKAEGNVGNGALIKANVIEIGGQTHQSAKLYGGDVSINLHKGFVDGETVTVDLLEGGKIVGDIVRVKKAAGGEIEAKEVYIETVLSNVNVEASHLIELDKVEGTGNKFIIDAKAQRGFKDKVETIETKISEMRKEVEQTTKKVRVLKNKINREKDTSMRIVETIKELQSKNVKPPASLVGKMKDNQNRIKEHNLLLKELKDAKMSEETLAEDLRDLQSSVFDAKVINHATWREFNEVIFRIINPPINASHLLRDGEMTHTFSLKTAEDGEFILDRKG